MTKDHKFAFEKLDVWQRSKELVIKIYKITNSFPTNEKFGLISQINRAALSVPSNIAEGSARVGIKNQSYFYTIAFSSLMELVSHLIIAKDLKYLCEDNYYSIKKLIYEISNKLNALQKSKRKQLNNSTVKHLNNSIKNN